MWRAALGAAAAIALAPHHADAVPTCISPAAPPVCVGPATPGEYMEEMYRRGYDKTQRPSCSAGAPTVVEVQFYLTQLNDINQKSGIMQLSGYFRTWWKDPRLAFNATANGGCFEEVVLMAGEGDRLWLPDIYFHTAVSKITDGFATLTSISPDGSVWRSEQTTFTVNSILDLGRLPYDAHTGRVVVASFAHPVSRVRLTARGGDIGPGTSGVGISAAPMSSTIWEFTPDTKEVGFKTPGVVEVNGDKDFLTLIFSFSRQSKYYIDQVIVPSFLFVFVSYMQFWVDPNIAPARAFLAVIPVLIMRTLSNSVYRSIPEGSQQMWLADNLFLFTLITVCGVLQFGVVQHCRVTENARAAKRQGLKTVREKTRELIMSAHADNMTLLDLLKKCEAVYGEATPAGRQLKASADAVARNVKESDMLFIRYSLTIFEKYDANDSKALNSSEVKSAFTYFDIYLSSKQAPTVMCMFLRDMGLTTPKDESKVELKFSHFVGLLIDIEKYMLKHGSSSIREYLEASPPSKRWDVLARVFVPTFVSLQLIFIYACLPLGVYG